MALTIVAITIAFIICAVIAYKAKANYPAFTDGQLLDQHIRFLDDLDSSRKYIGATYFHEVEKGSPAEWELTLRGYEMKALLRERASARREGRAINWNACRRALAARPAKSVLPKPGTG